MLVLLAVLTGAAAYLFTRHYYADVPSPARSRRPIHPIAVARLAALAKASSPVGVAMAGGYAGFLVHVSRLDGPQAGADTVTAALGTAFGLVLTVSALVLERACRVKTPPDN